MGMVDYSERFNAGNGGKLVTEVVRGRDKQTRNTHAQSVWHTTAKHAHIELRLWYTVRATARTLALVRKRKCPSGAEPSSPSQWNSPSKLGHQSATRRERRWTRRVILTTYVYAV